MNAALDAGATEEDVRPGRAKGRSRPARTCGVVAGGAVGEEEGGKDVALLSLAGGELLTAEAAGDAPHVVHGDE